MVELGRQALELVFAVGGAAAALAGVIAGIRIILANALGSGYALGQSIASLIVAMIGLGMMLFGPQMAAAVVNGASGLRQGLSSPVANAAATNILTVLYALGAVIAAVGISWNAVLMILDALFGASPEPSPVALNRILTITLMLGFLLLVPNVTNSVVAATREIIR